MAKLNWSPCHQRFAAPVACCLLTVAPQTPVIAQDTEEAVQEIVVTGSRIRRRDFTSASPITTVDRDTIEFSGQPTLEETLNQMPQVIPDYGRTSNNPGNGTSRINLRGMGAGRTLVMLNGRRLSPSGVGSAVDVNNLPQSLMERIEIVTGGATTVYGSDAVAGVVNFITRKDFTGLSFDASAYTTAQSDSNIYDINVVYGHELGGGRGNVTVYAGAYEREELFGSERDLGQKTLINDDNTGTLFEGGSSVVPGATIFAPRVDFGSGPSWTTFDPNGIPREFVDPEDRYNYAPINYLQTPLTRYSGGLMANYELNNGYELYLETALTQNESSQVLAPVPAFDFALINTDNPVLTPEAQQFFIDNYEVAPGLAQVGIGRRLVEVGPRIIDHDRQYWRTVVGMRGELTDGWDIDGWVTYTTSKENEFLLNDGSASRFVQGLLVDPVTGQCFDPSNGCVPIDLFGENRISADAADFLRITNVQNTTRRTQVLASVFVTGSPVDTWAGPLDTAVGLEWRSDDASFKADDVLFTGDTLGFAGDATVDGKEDVIEVYVEAIVPLASGAALAENLSLEVGGRYSDYDNAGGVWTYKVGGDWQPNESLRFRVMHQSSVRAPNNAELFQENFTQSGFFTGDDGNSDPCSASNDPVGNGNAEKCILQGLPADQLGIFQASSIPVNYIGGGNPALVPEEAKTITIGAVLTPYSFENWTFSVDYYDLQVEDSIGGIDAESVCFDPSNVSNLFCDNITRDPDPLGAAGNVVEVFEPSSNRGTISTKGIDTNISYSSELPDAISIFSEGSSLSINFIWTHTLEYDKRQAPTSDVASCAGYFGSFCDLGIQDFVGLTIPENRATTNFNYASGPLNIHLTSRWIDGTKNAAAIEAEFFGFPEPLLAIESVGSKHYLDLGVGYDFGESFRVKLGVNNLMDTGAPLMADQGSANNTDSGLYDIFGRSFYLGLTMNFFQ